MTKNNQQVSFNKLWNNLLGSSPDYSSQNRTVNALSIITLVMLIMLMPINFLTGTNDITYLLIGLIVLQLFLYYLSRVKKKYYTAVVIYAIASYIALIANFRYNSGIAGPTFLVFFLCFHLLIAITPRRMHLLWAVLHLLVGLTLIWTEYYYPDLAPLSYPSPFAQYIDYTTTYVICLGFIYVITNYLLHIYNKEKQIAAEHLQEIQKQNEKLKEIAWLQSHSVRNHVSTIMGLSQLFNEKDIADPVNVEVVKGIMATSQELDGVVKKINDIAVKANFEQLPKNPQ